MSQSLPGLANQPQLVPRLSVWFEGRAGALGGCSDRASRLQPFPWDCDLMFASVGDVMFIGPLRAPT